MSAISTARIRLSAADAHALARDYLLGVGFDQDGANVVADHVVDAALCGYEYSGLPKLLNVAEHMREHPPQRTVAVVHETAVSARIDGGNHVGMLTLARAADIAVAKAHDRGFAVVGATHTWMSGRSAHYVERIARNDLVGLHFVSSRPQVAPPGGTRAVLGTNPMAFGFPSTGDPLIVDFGTSAFMFTDLMLRERRGEPLPEGVAIDAQGRPTRDAARARGGAVLPFGGHKGFALSIAMAAMGVLAGSGDNPDHAGYLLIAIRPDLLVPLDEYRRELAALVARVKATPRQSGVDEIRIPSERAFRERARAQRDGIEIDRAIYDALRLTPA